MRDCGELNLGFRANNSPPHPFTGMREVAEWSLRILRHRTDRIKARIARLMILIALAGCESHSAKNFSRIGRANGYEAAEEMIPTKATVCLRQSGRS